MLTTESVRELFNTILEPKLKWNLNTLNLVKAITINDDSVSIKINLVTTSKQEISDLENHVKAKLTELGAKEINLEIGQVNVAEAGIKGIKHIILVGSGKGGVGKSNVALNLALALSQNNKKVGLMDADIYGPSIPTMLNIFEPPEVLGDECLSPQERFNIKTMSLGFLVNKSASIDWRGQIASGTIVQFIKKTNWGELDYLIIDLPPGTGDINLTITHSVKADGVIMVTIPTELSLADVKRSVEFFKARKVPILGIVENMQFMRCEHCNEINHPFNSKTNVADILNIDVVAELPLEQKFSEQADHGKPYILEYPDSEISLKFLNLASKLDSMVNKSQKNLEEQIACG